MLDGVERRRVLLIESDSGLRRDLAHALRRAGFPVDADSKLDVSTLDISSLKEAEQRYAAAVIDLSAPGADSWLSEGAEYTPTIVLSASEADTASSALQRASRANAAGTATRIDVLCKPFPFSALESLLLGMQSLSAESRTGLVDPILESEDASFRRVLNRARDLAKTQVPISLTGELGVGRLALARQIHAWSRSRREPCHVLDRAGIEAAGTRDANDAIAATLESALGGSLILVDVEDWSPIVRERLRSGLREIESANLRTIAVSRQALAESAREGRICVELQYRLESINLEVPPLRERVADHASLCQRIAHRIARELGMPAPRLEPDWIAATSNEGFPGNRLGLESRLRSALIRGDGDPARFGLLASRDLIPAPGPQDRGDAAVPKASLNLKELERDTIIRALAHWDGNRTRASESLGISVRTLRNKIRDYALR